MKTTTGKLRFVLLRDAFISLCLSFVSRESGPALRQFILSMRSISRNRRQYLSTATREAVLTVSFAFNSSMPCVY